MEIYLQIGNSTILMDAEAAFPISGGFKVTGKNVSIKLLYQPKEFYQHGWHSWALSTWVDAGEKVQPAFPTIVRAMHQDPFFANEERLNGSWVGAVGNAEDKVVLLGSLDLESHVFLDDDKLYGECQLDQCDWFVGIGDEQEVFSNYAKLLEEKFGRVKKEAMPRVWCSWYRLYQEINEIVLKRIIKELSDLPFDVIQVDDGWQKKVGEWEANEKFPGGMQNLATLIKNTGKKAGLWLAPLLVAESSHLYQKHPNWLLRDGNGKPVLAGFNWGEKHFALDTTQPEVLSWLSELMENVRAWGYDYVKLDFLNAGALPGIRQKDIPRETAFRQGLEVMRRSLKDAYLLTCGTPILPSLGLCDAMRIGPDVSGSWISNLETRILNDFAMSGTQNAIRTSLNRIWLKTLVHPDPDVVYFSSKSNSLTQIQKKLLQDLALITGFKATSDLPGELDAQEKSDLRQLLLSNPKVEQLSRYQFTLDGEAIDYEPFIGMPPALNVFEKVIQQIVNIITDLPFTWILFNSLTRMMTRKSLKDELRQ